MVKNKNESIHLTERDAMNILMLDRLNNRFRFYVRLWQIFFAIMFLTIILLILSGLKLALQYLFTW